MDDKQVAFIICTNDEEQYRECEDYINHLIVPEEFSIDIIKICEADSICEAYNAGMRSSEAKYKVYLHHDLLIINRNFIADMISCFNRHPKAALLGMIGRKNFNNREYLYQNEHFGALYETRIDKTVQYYYYSQEGCDEKVLHLDGLLMMTCIDSEWREDLFKGWHVYDVAHSLEMHRLGYEVYVPYMTTPWAIHDCGFLSIGDYPVQRDILLREYSEFFT